VGQDLEVFPIAEATMYEVDGRLIVASVDRSPDGIGVARDPDATLDGYPEIVDDVIGQAVRGALAACRHVPRSRAARQ
jgi:hypothetical protein